MFNNSYIKMGRYRRIAHILFNSTVTNELHDEIEYLSKLRKVTEINLTNSCKHYVIISDSVDRNFRNLMNQTSGMGFDVAVIWFEGSWPMSPDFENKLLESVDGEWQEFNWFVAGHILDRDNDDAPQFHNQCIVINLRNWDNLKTQGFGHYWGGPFPAYMKSKEHIHDSYTPMFLIPDPHGKGTLDLTPTKRRFDNLIAVALDNDMAVMNLNHDIRAEKHCCYPEDDVEETKHWLMDPDWANRQSIDMVNKFSLSLDEDKSELYGFKCMNTHVMYITNTESVPGVENYRCTVMTAPCSGLHQFKHMVNARDTLERVVWTDFSAAGIWWTQKVLAEWDGVDFNKFYRDNEQELKDNWMAYEANNYDPDLAESFENSFGDQETWLAHWDWIRSLDHTFMQVDMVRDWKKVADQIGDNETVFMQVSNIWQYEINYLNNGYFAPQAAFVGMVSEILNRNKDLYITGDSPGGVYYNYQNMKELVSIV